MEQSRGEFTRNVKGTTYVVEVETGENAKMTYEELIKRRILQESEALEPEKAALF